jgi:hypothetical protein
MKTVAAISFHNDQRLSMDVDHVSSIEYSSPIQTEDGQWFCEMLVRSANGVIALQLLADEPEKLRIHQEG